jgi:tetratricopeptide (TPR) repeat protein
VPNYSAGLRLEARYTQVLAMIWNGRERAAADVWQTAIAEAQAASSSQPAVMEALKWARVKLSKIQGRAGIEAAIHTCEVELARLTSHGRVTSNSGFDVWFGLAHAHSALGHYTEALEAALNSKRIQDRVTDPELKDTNHGQIDRMIGELYGNLGQHAKAVESLEPAFAFASRGGDGRRRTRAEIGIVLAQSYFALGQVDRARILLQEQLPMMENTRQKYRDLATKLQVELSPSAQR